MRIVRGFRCKDLGAKFLAPRARGFRCKGLGAKFLCKGSGCQVPSPARGGVQAHGQVPSPARARISLQGAKSQEVVKRSRLSQGVETETEA